MEYDMLSSISPTVRNGKDNLLLKCFREISTIDLQQNNCTQRLHLYALNNSRMQFDYAGLIALLKNNIANYVYSRRTYKEYVDNDTICAAVIDAQQKLISINENALDVKNYGSGGELGELLLYVFFESFLNAPKLLSKVEIKTNDNDFVKGFDGVHFRIKHYDTYSAYQVVYGEAKIKSDIKDAIKEAFQSLKAGISKASTDWGLIDGKFFDEILVDAKEAELLKATLIPKYRDASSNIENENAYGIFIGYSFSPTEFEGCTPKENINRKVQQDIENVKTQIVTLIESMPEVDSDYYIFFLPFNDAIKDKHSIMQQIAGVTVNESK